MAIQYKTIEFYLDYCSSLKDFVLVEPFIKDDEEYSYIAKIVPRQCIYNVVITVKIPYAFPHHRMYFSTSDLSGYPHLIPYFNGKGSWFCLNTAFAETAEAQLDEEFARLKGWFDNQIREDLPAHITNPDVIGALRTFNIYEGGNLYELQEIEGKCRFYFMGDFAKNPNNFKDHGYLNVKRQDSGTFIVYKNQTSDTVQIPYALIEGYPASYHTFASIARYANWNKQIWDFLLPDFFYDDFCHTELEISDSAGVHIPDDIDSFSYAGQQNEEKRKKQISDRDEAKKNLINQVDTIALSKELRDLLMAELNGKGRKKYPYLRYNSNVYVDPVEKQRQENKYSYFALAILINGELQWWLIATNLYSREVTTMSFPVSETVLYKVEKVNDIRLSFYKSEIITPEKYFGRGRLSPTLTSKKIVIIGTGAIGSHLAESLARGGAECIALWDSDIVVPGNICRSSYNSDTIGMPKVVSLADSLKRISPFCKVSHTIDSTDRDNTGVTDFSGGDFYGNINYSSQESCLNKLAGYDLVIDCTASNELLHFLSFADCRAEIISLCVTNRSNDLICASNRDGNIYEIRKFFLNGIEQDTGNYYEEGTGCGKSTFLASDCDIQSLVNLFLRTLNRRYETGQSMNSIIWHHGETSISSDIFVSYKLEKGSIRLVTTTGIISDIESMPVARDGIICSLYGGYNTDGSVIYLSGAKEQIYNMNRRVLAKPSLYKIGTACLSGIESNEIPFSIKERVEKDCLQDDNVIKNPVLFIYNSDGSIKPYLFINKEFVTFDRL